MTFSLSLFLLNVSKNASNYIDIISKNYTAKSLHKDQNQSLIIIASGNITKANCEHHIDCPVASPYILLNPISITDLFLSKPIIFLIHFSHKQGDDCDKVSNEEVQKNYFSNRVVLLLKYTCDVYML